MEDLAHSVNLSPWKCLSSGLDYPISKIIMWFPALYSSPVRPERGIFCMLQNLQATKGSRSPSLESNKRSFLKSLVPPQGNSRFLASGVWAKPRGLQSTDYTLWNSRKTCCGGFWSAGHYKSRTGSIAEVLECKAQGVRL